MKEQPKMSDVEKRSLYTILDLNEKASRSDIKRAYRRLSKQFHPDIAGQDSLQAFQEISNAYAVLIDDQTRAYYDKTGLVDDNVDIFNEVQNMLLKVFDKTMELVLESRKPIENIDMVASIRSATKETMSVHAVHLETMSNIVESMLKLRKRIVRTGESENLFSDVLSIRIKDTQKLVVQHSMIVRAAKLLLAELDHYKDEAELIIAMQARTTKGWTVKINPSENNTDLKAWMERVEIT